ncbi:MAG: hypothetical protein IKJ01_01760 [Lachnospiraceae bacterium]|nr:hypothetical protein [Lachnospiraceae bacterium]
MTVDMLNEYQKNYTRLLKENNTSIMRSYIHTEIKPIKDENNKCFSYFQGKTGYCWLVAALQCISMYHEKKNGIKEIFDLNRLIFFDKLEKANMFFTLILDNMDNDIESPINDYVLKNAMSDKGQWSMACNLIKKYGLTPLPKAKDFGIRSTHELNACISYLMRIYALEIRNQIDNKDFEKVLQTKQMAMQKIYNMLMDFYGITCELIIYNDKEMTPQEYFKKIVQFPLEDYISICVDDKECYIEYEIEYDGNIYEESKNKFLKLPNYTFEQLIENQIMLDGFCWCSIDAGKFYIKRKKMLDDSVFDLKIFFNNEKLIKLNRDIIYRYHIGHMTHAIVLYKASEENIMFYDSAYTENSGSECCMSRSWFEKFLFQGVIHKNLLPKNIQITTKKVTPWDFFSL